MTAPADTPRSPAPFGTTAWARTRDGCLSATERLAELARGIASLARAEGERLGHRVGLAPRAFSLALDEVAWPDTPLTRAALARLETTPAWNVGHSLRTYVFGAVLARRDGVTFDAELAFAAAALHDLGLVEPGPEACFAHRGAELARAVVLGAGATSDRAAAVADAICQHVDVSASPAEAFVVRTGAGFDVIGDRYTHLAPAVRRATIARWPRDRFAASITERLEAEARAHPGTRPAFLCGPLRFPQLVRRAERWFLRDARR